MSDSSWYIDLLPLHLIHTHLPKIRTWAWVPVWSQIEVDIGILAASLPSLSPLLAPVWTGSPSSRAATPSEMPDFPEYRVSWSHSTLTDGFVPDMEKAAHVRMSCYSDDKPDEEDMKMATARMITIRRPSRVKYTKI
jgi:hypothetical protein